MMQGLRFDQLGLASRLRTPGCARKTPLERTACGVWAKHMEVH